MTFRCSLPLVWTLGISAACVLVACSDEERPGGHPGNSSGGTSGAGAEPSTAGSGGAAAGEAGAGGGSQAGGAAGAAGSSGAGGVVTVPVDGGVDGGDEPIPSCVDGRAFRAAGAAFVSPTPVSLASALNELVYEPTAHPLTIATLARGATGTVAVSFTELHTDAIHERFPEAFAPTSASLSVIDNQLVSGAPQTTGYLRLTDASGEVEIELNELSVDAVPINGCDALRASVSAVIPETQGEIALSLADGEHTLSALAASDGLRDGGGGGPCSVKLVFDAEGVDFDFDSFPE